jgi:hypothetical protein
MLPMPRKEHYLSVILSPAEVLRFLEAAPSFPHRVIFSTMYGTSSNCQLITLVSVTSLPERLPAEH